MHVCMYVYMYIYVCMYIYVYMCLFVCMNQCVYIYIRILSNMQYYLCDVLRFSDNILHRIDRISALKFTD